MTKEEEYQFIKNTAFNKIRAICNPSSKNYYDMHGGSIAEQKYHDILYIVEKMEEELLKCKNKHLNPNQ